MQVKLRKVRISFGTTFPKEILEKIDLKESDELSIAVMEDGMKLMAYDSEFEQMMDACIQ